MKLSAAFLLSILNSLVVVPAMAEMNLVWSDEFNIDGPPDPSIWGFENGFVRNHELQWYQKENATCSGGFLIIEGRKESKPNPNYQAGSSDWTRSRQTIEYTSSSLTSKGKREFKYGRWEFRARIDTRAGSWPAWWAMSAFTGWPENGEIDMMEYYQNITLFNVIYGLNGSTVYDSKPVPIASFGDPEWGQKFHVWQMDWDSTQIRFSLDSVTITTWNLSRDDVAGKTNPYRMPKYMILNQAIGGDAGGSVGNTVFPLRYEIDYVRVYQEGPPISVQGGPNPPAKPLRQIGNRIFLPADPMGRMAPWKLFRADGKSFRRLDLRPESWWDAGGLPSGVYFLKGEGNISRWVFTVL